MIYDFPDADAPIRQGDIFFRLPRVDISLNAMLEYSEGDVTLRDWSELFELDAPTIITAVRPVIGIVASQDCDLVRGRDVSFCEVRPFIDIERKCKDTKKPESWQSIITQQARLNLKWFYLPPDAAVGFEIKMAADFQTIFRAPRTELETRRSDLRKGRLNDVAAAHFRERISDFFRRYAYDEWYPLDQAEMAAYEKSYPGSERFPWQKL